MLVTYVSRRWLRGAHAAAAAVGLRTLLWFPLLLQFSILQPTFQFYGHVTKIQAGTNKLRPSRSIQAGEPSKPYRHLAESRGLFGSLLCRA